MKKQVFVITVILYQLIVLSSIFRFFIPISPTIYPILIFIISFSLYPQYFPTPSFFAFLAYALTLTVYLIFGVGINTIGFGGSDFKKFLIELAFILPSISIANVLRQINDPSVLKRVSISGIVILAVTLLITFPQILSDNTLLRLASTSLNTGTTEMYQEYASKGLPNYSLLHSYVIVFPIIVGLFLKKKGKQKVLWGMMGLLIAFTIIRSVTTTLMLIMFLNILIILIYRKRNRYMNLVNIFAVIFIFYLLLSFKIFDSASSYLIKVFAGTSAESKMTDLRILLNSGEVGLTVTGRQEFHRAAWERFIESPLVGTSGGGGHSTFLDHLGGAGILGFIPFVLIFFYQFQEWTRTIPSQSKIYFYLGWFSALILLYSKGLFGQEGWFMLTVLLPSMTFIFSKSYENHLLNKEYKV